MVLVDDMVKAMGMPDRARHLQAPRQPPVHQHRREGA
jgi:hypothetical protein